MNKKNSALSFGRTDSNVMDSSIPYYKFSVHPENPYELLVARERLLNSNGEVASGLSQTSKKKSEAFFDDNVLFDMLIKKAGEKSIKRAKDIEKIDQIKSKLVVDSLAKTWLHKKKWDKSTRLYVIYNILPVLVLGLIKVLKEAEKRNLINTDNIDHNFNPLNYLARYLLRNNPRHSPFQESHPYVHGLRAVAILLLQELDDYSHNNLAKVKKEAFIRRISCEAEIMEKQKEEQRRVKALKTLYTAWNGGRRISLNMAQNALLSFEAHILSQQETEHLNGVIEVNAQQGKNLLMERFVQYMLPIVSNLSAGMFDAFCQHMYRCIEDFKIFSKTHDASYEFEQIFKLCNTLRLGYVTKAKVVETLKSFYARLNKQDKETVLDPYKWPLDENGELGNLSDFVPNRQSSSGYDDEVSYAYNGPKSENPREVNIDFEQVLEPAVDSINPMGSPDIISQNLLVTPIDSNKDYKDYFSDKNVKYAVLDYHKLKSTEERANLTEETATKCIRLTNLTIIEAEPTLNIDVIKSVEFANSTNLLPMWKLWRHNKSDSMNDLMNSKQFCHYLLNFLGKGIMNKELVNRLTLFMLEGVKLTEEEKIEAIQKFKKLWEEEKMERLPGEIFEGWDLNVSGYLSLRKVFEKIRSMKIFSDSFLKLNVLKSYVDHVGREDKIAKNDFKYLLSVFIENLPENYRISQFYNDLVLKTDTDKKIFQLNERRKAIHQILYRAELNPHCMNPVYEELVHILKSTVIQEKNENSTERNTFVTISFIEKISCAEIKNDYFLLKLHFKSEENDLVQVDSYLQYLPDSMSYKVLKTKKMIVLRSLVSHPNIISDLWDRHLREDVRDGSIIFCPIMDVNKRVLGVLTVYNLPPVTEVSSDPSFPIDEKFNYIDKKFFEDSEENINFQNELQTSDEVISMMNQSLERSEIHLLQIDEAIRPTKKSMMTRYESIDSEEIFKKGSVKSVTKEKNVKTEKVLKNMLQKEENVYISDEKIDFIQGLSRALSISIEKHMHFVKMKKAFTVIFNFMEHFNSSTNWCAIYRVGYNLEAKDNYLHEMVVYDKNKKLTEIAFNKLKEGGLKKKTKIKKLRSELSGSSSEETTFLDENVREKKLQFSKNSAFNSEKTDLRKNLEASLLKESHMKTISENKFKNNSNNHNINSLFEESLLENDSSENHMDLDKITGQSLSIPDVGPASTPKIKIESPPYSLPYLSRLYNLYRPMLFACVDSGLPKYGKCLEHHYWALPIKDLQNQTKFVLYLDLGGSTLKISDYENLLFYQTVCTKALHYVLEQDTDKEESKRDLENVVRKISLDYIASKLASQIKYKDWNMFVNLPSVPLSIRNIMITVVTLIYPEIFQGEFSNWETVRSYMDSSLIPKILHFDPFDNNLNNLNIEEYKKIMEGVPRNSIIECNYAVIYSFYEWALFSVNTIIEIRNTRSSKGQEKCIGKMFII